MDMSSIFAISLQSESEDPRMRIATKSASTKTGVDDDNDPCFIDPRISRMIGGYVEVCTVRISVRGSTDYRGLAILDGLRGIPT